MKYLEKSMNQDLNIKQKVGEKLDMVDKKHRLRATKA